MSRGKKRKLRRSAPKQAPTTQPGTLPQVVKTGQSSRSTRRWLVALGLVAAVVVVGALQLPRFVGDTDSELVETAGSGEPDAGLTFNATKEPSGVALPSTDDLPHEGAFSTAEPALAADAILTETFDAAKIDVGKATWPSEVFSDQADAQLKALGKLIEHPQQLSEQSCRDLVDASFHCDALRPPELEAIFENGAFIVRRPRGRARVPRYQAAAGLEAALRDLITPFEFGSELHAKFKIVDAQVTGRSGSTSILVLIRGRQSGCYVQQNATWKCAWRLRQDGHPPTLVELGNVPSAYEEVTYQGDDQPLFTDVTELVLGGNRCLGEQFSPGINYWLARLETAIGIDLVAANGVAVGDVDGDGREDVYVCQTGGLPNRLFIANPDGTATDQAADYGVAFSDNSGHALLVDLDNDGDQDFVILLANDVAFFELESGRYRLRDRHVVLSGPKALTAADFDLDGLLDVYVVNHDAEQAEHGVFGTPVPYHDANNGGINRLFRNVGSLKFKNVTAQVGLDANNARFSLAAAWEDYDQDGDPDLYVANDFGRNNLYRNDGGRFVDVAAEAGVEDISAGMSVSWGDYNNDGWLDLYVSNMFSSAGNRVTYQRKFTADRDEQLVAEMRRHARGNSLFENLGDATFRDVSMESNVTMGRWAWASSLADVNNDGWQDLLIANGFITNEDVVDL